MNRIARLVTVALLSTASAPTSTFAAPAPADTPTARVRTVHAGTGDGVGAGEAGAWIPASVVAVDRATLSTRVAAAVQAVHVQEGQRVTRGQLVLSLSDADLRGALAAARTSLDAAVAQERRIRTLLSQRAATQAELDLATTQRAQAEAAVAAARANLEYAQLRAPFAGTIQARRVDPGDLVGPAQPLLVLEGDALELQASVSEAEATGLALGKTVPYTAGGVRGTAVITALTPGADPISHRRSLRARIEKLSGLRSGAFARLQVPGGSPAQERAQERAPERAWVPRTALVERGDLTGVFVASAGRAELRWIAVGEPAGGGVMVRAGVRPGELIVDAPGALRDGQPVEVVP